MAEPVAESARALVDRYLAHPPDPLDVDRLVVEPCGLGAAGMLAALSDARMAEPANRSHGVALMADFMAPDGSLYYDAIYGAFHGQAAIRRWLVPTMAEIDFIEFVPTADPVLFDDGRGGTSLDEWQMFAAFGDERVALSRGVSVRRYRGGWITWACDVYDTGAFRQPPPPGVEAAPLPPWPRVDWEPDPACPELRAADLDVAAFVSSLHPTDAEYHDPVFGVVRGREAIGAWLGDVLPRLGDVVFEPLGPLLDDGSVTVQEWQQRAVLPDGERMFMTRGTSVRRRRDGQVVYAADYFDTAPLLDPAVQAASAAAGATLTPDDVARWRSPA